MTYLIHRSERDLLQDAAAHAAQEREGRNQLVVDIAEIDARGVYRQAGYDSVQNYCMGELGLSKKAALHRIHVARVAWRFPVVLAALADGRLHVTAVGMLATHFTENNAAELVGEAANKTKPEIRSLLAARFPPRESPILLLEVCLPAEEKRTPEIPGQPPEPEQSAEILQRPPEGVEVLTQTVPIFPPVPERFPLKVALERKTHEKLDRARDLLGHQIPSGDVAAVLDRALDELITKLEKRKFAATTRPRVAENQPRSGARYVPADVRRAVWMRDGGQCTFHNEAGMRCAARRMLEFDHIEPVARGGASTVDNLRLRCRAHNQLVAEHTFGSAFMERKRKGED